MVFQLLLTLFCPLLTASEAAVLPSAWIVVYYLFIKAELLEKGTNVFQHAAK